MATNTLNITPDYDKARIDLHGDMDVLFDTQVTNDFSVILFTSTSEIFTLRSTTLQFIDSNGVLTSSFNIGGRPNLFVELMFNPVARVWRIVTTNIVAGTSSGTSSGGIDTTEKTLTMAALPNLTAVDLSLGCNFRAVLTANAKLANPVNMNPGDRARIILVQDAVGSRVLTFSGAYGFIQAQFPTLTTTPGAQDVLDIYKTGDGSLICEMIYNVSIVRPIAYVQDFAFTMVDALAAAQNSSQDGLTVQVIRDGWHTESNTLVGYQTTRPYNIRVRGVPKADGTLPVLKLDRTDRPTFDKAVMNIEGGQNVVIENLQLSGASSADNGNACGVFIAANPVYTLLKNLHIYNNEDGVRTAMSIQPHFDIEDCWIEKNGVTVLADEIGQTHNIYAGNNEIVRINRTTFADSIHGHNIKSRAYKTVLNQVLSIRSLESREMDIPDQGIVQATDCVFYKSASGTQNNLVGLGYECTEGFTRTQEYFFINCYFHNDVDPGRNVSWVDNMARGVGFNNVPVHFIDCEFGGIALTKVQYRESLINGPYTITLTGGPTGPRVPVGCPQALFDTSLLDPNRSTNPIGITLTPLANLPPMTVLEPTPPYPNVFIDVPIVPPLPSFNADNSGGGGGGSSGGTPGPDTIPPVISIQASTTNVVVAGDITLTASANDNVGVVKVEFYGNGILLNTLTARPFTQTVTLSRTDDGTINYIAKAYDAAGNTATSDPAIVTVNIPIPHIQPTTTLDSNTQAEYDAAISAAVIGSKRLAAANAIVNAMKPAHQLYIYCNGTLIVPIQYSGDMLVEDDGYDVSVEPSTTITSSDPLVAADLTQGTWWFEVQGGANFGRILSGSVGPVGSGKDLILDTNPAPGQGFSANLVFVIPRSVDGLS